MGNDKTIIIDAGLNMFDYAKTVAAFYEFLEKHDIKNLNDLPPEKLKMWLYLKDGQRLNLYMQIEDIPEKSKKKLRLIKGEKGAV